MKWLLWLVIVLLVLAWVMRPRNKGTGAAPANSDRTGVEDMVQCDYCKTYVPQSQSIRSDHSHPVFFCSHEHRRLADRSTQ